MAIWLDDLVEQIATSMVLTECGTETGKRLAFIIVDNAVEFLMKAFVESEARIVGHGKPISKKDWENKKHYFEQVLDVVYGHFTITASRTDILAYHDVRNDLYHQGKPLSANSTAISSYTTLLKIMLKDLHGFDMKSDDWIKRALLVSKKIAHEETISSKKVIKYVNQNGLLRFETDLDLKDTLAICHAIYEYSIHNGREPNIDDIELILAMSGHPLERNVIQKRISHLRNNGKLIKTKRMLTSNAVRELKKSFAIIK